MELSIVKFFKTLLSNSMVLRINSNLLKQPIKIIENELFPDLLKRYDVKIVTEAEMFNEKTTNPQGNMRWASKFYIKSFLRVINDLTDKKSDIDSFFIMTKYSLDIDQFYSRYSIETDETIKIAIPDIIQVGFWEYVTTTSKCVALEKLTGKQNDKMALFEEKKADLKTWISLKTCIELTRMYYISTGFLIHDVYANEKLQDNFTLVNPIDIYEIASFVGAKFKLAIYLANIKKNDIYKILEIYVNEQNVEQNKNNQIKQYKNDSNEISLAKWTFSLADSLHNQGKTVKNEDIKDISPDIDGLLALPENIIKDKEIIVGNTSISSKDLMEALKIAIRELKTCKFMKGEVLVPAEIIPNAKIISWIGNLCDSKGEPIKKAIKKSTRFLILSRAN